MGPTLSSFEPAPLQLSPHNWFLWFQSTELFSPKEKGTKHIGLLKQTYNGPFIFAAVKKKQEMLGKTK